MSLTNPEKVITEQRLSEFYGQILPYLGGMPEALANKFDKANLYSETEKIVGCWVDGRPLYQKTFDFGNLPGNTTKTIDHNISNLDRVVDLFGMAQKSDRSDIIPLPFTSAATNITSLYANTTKIGSKTLTTGMSAYYAYITIQYTKTTDAANSFNIGSDTDYSTDEKIVGTWIDGKPIYKYTYVTTSDVTLANNSWTTVFTYDGSIETMIKTEAIRKTTNATECISYPVGCAVVSATSTAVKFKVDASSSIVFKAGSVFTIYFTKTT